MTEAVATCGRGILPGMIWRPGDPLKHLGPPESLGIPFDSSLFQTRCGLERTDGQWRQAADHENDDVWCPGCLAQAGLAHRVEPL